MQAARTLISVEEYLTTMYHPDCDYVDGEVLERNFGEGNHAWLQTALSSFFFVRRKEWNITVLTEMRVQVKPTRFRIPDICVVLGDTDEKILTEPPFLCIEILSPDDRWSRVKARMNDFLEMGVPYIWVVDSETRQAYVAPPGEGLREVREAVFRTDNPTFEFPLSELFS